MAHWPRAAAGSGRRAETNGSGWTAPRRVARRIVRRRPLNGRWSKGIGPSSDEQDSDGFYADAGRGTESQGGLQRRSGPQPARNTSESGRARARRATAKPQRTRCLGNRKTQEKTKRGRRGPARAVVDGSAAPQPSASVSPARSSTVARGDRQPIVRSGRRPPDRSQLPAEQAEKNQHGASGPQTPHRAQEGRGTSWRK